jgi:hypothetical protein
MFDVEEVSFHSSRTLKCDTIIIPSVEDMELIPED